MFGKLIELVFTGLLHFWGALAQLIIYVGGGGTLLFLILAIPLYVHIKARGL